MKHLHIDSTPHETRLHKVLYGHFDVFFIIIIICCTVPRVLQITDMQK